MTPSARPRAVPLRTRAGLGIVAATLIVGCSVAPPDPRVSSGPSASILAVLPSASASTEVCPELPTEPPPPDILPVDLDEATRAAIKGRAEYGLRRDLQWVRLVAADPRASTAFGFPLLPEEEQSLFARHDPAEAVQRVLIAYGHTDELGGLYIDNALGGTVVVLWTSNLDAHAAAILAQLPPCHPVIFRRVRWSEAELRRWQNKIFADSQWFRTIPAAGQGFGADIKKNVVTISVSSANPNAGALIVAHYAAPAGMIEVESDGTGAVLLPWGTVKGVVVTRDGRAPGPNNFGVEQAIDGPPGTCGGGDIGFGVAPDGRFESPCQVGIRTIQISEGGRVFGQVRVEIVAGRISVVRIVVEEVPTP
jgi:hypothetical protein